MFEKFTEKALKSIFIADREATKVRSESTKPEHVLVGLYLEGSGIAFKQLDAAKFKMPEEYGGISVGRSEGDINFAAETEKLFEAAYSESVQLKQGYIGTEHLLLAALIEPTVKALLAQQGIDATSLRADLLRLLGERSET